MSPERLEEIRSVVLAAQPLGRVSQNDPAFKESFYALDQLPDVARELLAAYEASAAGPQLFARVRYPSGWHGDVVALEPAGAVYNPIDPGVAAPLMLAFPDARLSENFSLSEFRPGKRSYEYIRVSPSLIASLEEIRGYTGRPVTVTSGYRPPAYNREVGGAANSCHIDGLAADIYCEGVTVDELYDLCEEVIGYRGGIGYYPKSGFIHVDVRGYHARWSGR